MVLISLSVSGVSDGGLYVSPSHGRSLYAFQPHKNIGYRARWIRMGFSNQNTFCFIFDFVLPVNLSESSFIYSTKSFFRSIYCFCLPCQYMDTKRIQMKLLFYLPITRLRKSDFSLRFVNTINTKVTGPDNNPVPECIGVHCVWLSGCVPGLGPLSAGFISDGWGQCPVCHCMSSSHSSGPPSHWHLSRQAVSHVVWDHMQMSCIHVCSPIRTGHKTCKQLLAYEALNNINTASLSPYSPHSHLKQTTN